MLNIVDTLFLVANLAEPVIFGGTASYFWKTVSCCYICWNMPFMVEPPPELADAFNIYIYIFIFFMHEGSMCILGVPRGASLLGHVAASYSPTCA
jgi:hypothetical protein